MDKDGIIQQAEQYVRQQMSRDSSGHDYWHAQRVCNTAVRLAVLEEADRFVCELAALLHDVADEKLNESKETGLLKVQDWLEQHVPDREVSGHIMQIIETMSFGGGGRPPMETLEGQVVQDADRLDALGAIGIARTFAYTGWKGRSMHEPGSEPRVGMTEQEYRRNDGTAINHFYEKLLLLKDRMNTRAAREMAEERDAFMRQFLQQFYREWGGSWSN